MGWSLVTPPRPGVASAIQLGDEVFDLSSGGVVEEGHRLTQRGSSTEEG